MIWAFIALLTRGRITPLRKAGAGRHEVHDDQQDNQNPENPGNRPEPAAPFPGRGRNRCCISHKIPIRKELSSLREMLVNASLADLPLGSNIVQVCGLSASPKSTKERRRAERPVFKGRTRISRLAPPSTAEVNTHCAAATLTRRMSTPDGWGLTSNRARTTLIGWGRFGDRRAVFSCLFCMPMKAQGNTMFLPLYQHRLTLVNVH